MIRQTLTVLLCMTSFSASLLGAQPIPDPDWPCAQIFVSQVSAAVVWDGPPIETATAGPQEEQTLRPLISQLSARRTSLSEAETLIL